jgi:ATP-dependent Clp protease adaptor protein ClpS
MAQSDTRTRIKPSEAVKEPPMFRVVYLNDNATSMEFVVESLVEYFEYTPETAEQITIDIHEDWQCLCGSVAL